MTFLPGLELSQRFYSDAVRPILDRDFPGLRYSAALIGFGSDVIGFDDPQSTDHMWGPRLYLFLSEEEWPYLHGVVLSHLQTSLPHSFLGHSTHFVSSPGEPGVYIMGKLDDGPLHPLVWVENLRGFVRDYLGFDLQDEPAPADWLTFSEHKLLSLVSGAVFHDGLQALEPMRQRLTYYPKDVWLYLLAGDWQKIGQEEPFVGRTGQVGDDLGSRLIAARLVHTLMHLGFLMERRYAPYSKWFGTGFAGLASSKVLGPHLTAALAAEEWPERERHLGLAYETAAELHNQLGITPPVPTRTSSFHNRPFQIIHADQISAAILEAVQDPRVKTLPGNFGSINQWIDSTDLIDNASLRERFLPVYRAEKT